MSDLSPHATQFDVPPYGATPHPLDLPLIAHLLSFGSGEPQAIEVRRTARGRLDLRTTPLTPHDGLTHPADLLVGYTAPEYAAAFGICADARVAVLDTCADAPAVDPPDAQVADQPVTGTPVTDARRHGRLVHLVARDGRSLSVLRDSADDDDDDDVLRPTTDPLVIDSTAPVAGFTADACRRVLGLPTAPTDARPAAWSLAPWLDQILEDALASPCRAHSLGWEQLVSRHPCAAHLDASADAAALVSQLAATSPSWEALRRAVADRVPWEVAGGSAAAALCSAERAAWLDAPAFARHLTGSLPDPSVLAGVVCSLLDDSLAERLCEVLRLAQPCVVL